MDLNWKTPQLKIITNKHLSFYKNNQETANKLHNTVNLGEVSNVFTG